MHNFIHQQYHIYSYPFPKHFSYFFIWEAFMPGESPSPASAPLWRGDRVFWKRVGRGSIVCCGTHDGVFGKCHFIFLYHSHILTVTIGFSCGRDDLAVFKGRNRQLEITGGSDGYGPSDRTRSSEKALGREPRASLLTIWFLKQLVLQKNNWKNILYDMVMFIFGEISNWFGFRKIMKQLNISSLPKIQWLF